MHPFSQEDRPTPFNFGINPKFLYERGLQTKSLVGDISTYTKSNLEFLFDVQVAAQLLYTILTNNSLLELSTSSNLFVPAFVLLIKLPHRVIDSAVCFTSTLSTIAEKAVQVSHLQVLEPSLWKDHLENLNVILSDIDIFLFTLNLAIVNETDIDIYSTKQC